MNQRVFAGAILKGRHGNIYDARRFTWRAEFEV